LQKLPKSTKKLKLTPLLFGRFLALFQLFKIYSKIVLKHSKCVKNTLKNTLVCIDIWKNTPNAFNEKHSQVAVGSYSHLCDKTDVRCGGKAN
jgi:hypothetical protein